MDENLCQFSETDTVQMQIQIQIQLQYTSIYYKLKLKPRSLPLQPAAVTSDRKTIIKSTLFFIYFLYRCVYTLLIY